MDLDTPPRFVLYVEDDRINIVLMEEVLRPLKGWRLECVETGEQALEVLARQSPDLVLIDMNLPDMNGLELMRRLRQDPRHAQRRCIVLSADLVDNQRALAREAGFADYWLKPIDVQQLRRALQDMG